ncbi:MAG: hypothetical protein U1G05_05565 [Kiritimatiellia bacterium]
MYALLLAGRSCRSPCWHAWRPGNGPGRRGARLALAVRVDGIAAATPARTRAGGAAFLLAFLPAFAEFDTASFLLAKSWAVNLFDAQAGACRWRESAAGGAAAGGAGGGRGGTFCLLARPGRHGMRCANGADAGWPRALWR